MSNKSLWKQIISPSLISAIRSFNQLLESVCVICEPGLGVADQKILKLKRISFKHLYEGKQDNGALLKQGSDVVSLLKSGMKLDELADKASSDFLLFSVFHNLSLISEMLYKKDIKALYQEAKSGNIESLCRLLQIDKSLFDHKWLRKMMMENLVRGNYDFFKRIGNAVKTEPPLGRIKQGKLIMILRTFWQSGLNTLTIPGLISLLEHCGIQIHEDPESFRKLIDRVIKPQFPSHH